MASAIEKQGGKKNNYFINEINALDKENVIRIRDLF